MGTVEGQAFRQVGLRHFGVSMMRYSDRVKCKSCENGSGPHGCTDCLNTGRDFQAFAGGIEQALNDAYAEGRKDEREHIMEQIRKARETLQAAIRGLE
jgi:hypothetical protein